jgi:hypothetical protein
VQTSLWLAAQLDECYMRSEHLSVTKEQLEMTAEAMAIAGPLATATRELFFAARDRSLARKARKAVEEIGVTVERMEKLANLKATTNVDLQEYRLQSADDLHRLVAELGFVRTKIRDREARKNAEPTGLRRWFLWYRPEGFDAWTLQTLFYAGLIGSCAAGLLMLLYNKSDESTPLLLVKIAALSVPFLLYFRSLSLRLKRIAVTKRSNPRGDFGNRDIPRLKRYLLLFKPRGVRAVILHALYYIFAPYFAVVPVLILISERWEPWVLLVIVAIEAWGALTLRILWVDALLSRSLDRIGAAAAPIATVANGV